MLYTSEKDWRAAERKKVMLFGMSGLGKTYLSNILRDSGDWFHYSVDYRIGTRYMGEHIVDNFKKEAMRNPFLADLLRSDSIYIASNLRFNNLSPLSSYLGKPGDPAKGGIPFAEYLRRQRLHRAAEINAMKDTVHFIDRAKELYDYNNFVCDTSGSIVEIVDPANRDDEVLSLLSEHMLPVWIEGGETYVEELVERFSRDPKPMYYSEEFLTDLWDRFQAEKRVAPDKVDPDEFIRWGFRKLVGHRLPRYRTMADIWGITVKGDDVAKVRTKDDFENLIAAALEKQA